METALRQPDIADVFERVLVPSIFERYARDLIERARPIGPSDRVLDLGCGTGIVARLLRERLGGAARVTGLDASAAMIAKAREVAPELSFREGNAMSLPFDDASFDLVLCQQMLQFVPDKRAALREIRRVLAPGGRLIASTWLPRDQQPLYEALGKVAERHLGEANDKRFALDGEELHALLVEAGFVEVRLDHASLKEDYEEFPIRLSAMAANFDLSTFDDAERERRFAALEAESREVLAKFSSDTGFSARSTTNVVSAISPTASATSRSE